MSFNVVAVACILATMSFARGPLFHRALTITDNAHKSSGSKIDLKIAPSPLAEFLAGDDSNPLQQGSVSVFFAGLVKGVGAGSLLAYDQPTSFGDYCIGTIRGYAFKTTCNLESRSTDLDNVLQECKACTAEECRSDCELHRSTSLSSTFFSASPDMPSYTSERRYSIRHHKWYHRSQDGCPYIPSSRCGIIE